MELVGRSGMHTIKSGKRRSSSSLVRPRLRPFPFPNTWKNWTGRPLHQAKRKPKTKTPLCFAFNANLSRGAVRPAITAPIAGNGGNQNFQPSRITTNSPISRLLRRNSRKQGFQLTTFERSRESLEVVSLRFQLLQSLRRHILSYEHNLCVR